MLYDCVVLDEALLERLFAWISPNAQDSRMDASLLVAGGSSAQGIFLGYLMRGEASSVLDLSHGLVTSSTCRRP